MTFRDVINWLAKTAASTGLGTVFGAITGASSGAVGNAIVLSMNNRDHDYTTAEGTLVTTVGSAAVGGVIGFLAPTMSTCKIFECLSCCGPGIGLMAAPAFLFEQAFSAVIGIKLLEKLLNELNEFPLVDAGTNAGIGSIFTMGFMLILLMCSWCLPIKELDDADALEIGGAQATLDRAIDTGVVTSVMEEEKNAEVVEQKEEEEETPAPKLHLH